MVKVRTLLQQPMQLVFGLLSILLLMVIVWPLGYTLFAASPASLGETLLDAAVRRSFGVTFSAAMIATLIALLCGVPLAYLLARSDFPGKALVEGVINLPIVIPHSAAGIALLMVFGRRGSLGAAFDALGVQFVSARPGIVLAMLFVSMPYLVSAARESFEAVDVRLEYVARTLGATPWYAFRTIALPIAARGILSGALLMWARGISEFGAVVILAFHPMVIPVLLYERFEAFGLRAAQPVASLVIAICLMLFGLVRVVAGPRSRSAGDGVQTRRDLGVNSRFISRRALDALASTAEPYGDAVLTDSNSGQHGSSVHLRNLEVSVEEFELRGVNLHVQPGEYLVILGPTGAGKTVLLETIAGLRAPRSGEILVDGVDITRLPCEVRNVGFVYQDYALFPHMTVAQNIAYGLAVRHVASRVQRARVTQLAQTLGIGHLLDRMPATLSGGEQQRVALARALIVHPRLLLLDEPLSALDPRMREDLQRELAWLHRRTGMTKIHITHDFEEAVALADRIAIVSDGEIVQVGTPEEVFRRPASPLVAEFVGVRNIFEGVILRRGAGYAVLDVQGTELAVVTPLSGHVHAALRPEDVILSTQPLSSSARNCLRGRITRIDDRGALVYVTVSVPPSFVCAITRASLEEMGLAVGSEVYIAFKASAVHVF